MRILIDMDGVIADFEGYFLQRWKELYPERKYIPIEDRRGFYLREQYPEEYIDHVQEIYHGQGFYLNLPPIPGSLEALKELKEKTKHIFLCSSPMLPKYENCVLEKYHWVYKHLGEEWVHDIILTKDKTIIKGDILIDDMPEVKGAEKPEWEHVLYDQPYNKDINGKRRLTWENWKTILDL